MRRESVFDMLLSCALFDFVASFIYCCDKIFFGIVSSNPAVHLINLRRGAVSIGWTSHTFHEAGSKLPGRYDGATD